MTKPKRYRHLPVKTRGLQPADFEDWQGQVSQFYDAISEQYEAQHYNRFSDEILEFILLHCLDDRKSLAILDAGGGAGRFAIPLARAGHDVLLYDISQGMLDAAQRSADKQGVKLTYRRGSIR